MHLQTDVPALALMPFFERPLCPQCGESMFAATATRYFGAGRIHHSWSCDSCQHEFQTAIEMPEHLR